MRTLEQEGINCEDAGTGGNCEDAGTGGNREDAGTGGTVRTLEQGEL